MSRQVENSFWWEIFGGKFLREIAKKKQFFTPKKQCFRHIFNGGLGVGKGSGNEASCITKAFITIIIMFT